MGIVLFSSVEAKENAVPYKLSIALRNFIPGFNRVAQYFKPLNNCRSWAVAKTSRKTFAPNCT
jgi:hypothetical protein